MSKPRYEPQHDDYTRDVYFFYDVLSRFSGNKKLLVHFLRDFFTKSELRMFRRRWHVSCLLADGHDIRLVATMAKSSTLTVMRVKKMIEEGLGAWEKALALVGVGRAKDLEELAEAKSKKFLPKLPIYGQPKMRNINKFTRWVFGAGGPE